MKGKFHEFHFGVERTKSYHFLEIFAGDTHRNRRGRVSISDRTTLEMLSAFELTKRDCDSKRVQQRQLDVRMRRLMRPCEFDGNRAIEDSIMQRAVVGQRWSDRLIRSREYERHTL